MLVSVFRFWQTIDDPAQRKEYEQEFVFHMTDWLKDLDRLADLYERPNGVNKKEAADIIFGWFIHALPHMNAAGRILLEEIGDPFKDLYRPTKRKRASKTRG